MIKKAICAAMVCLIWSGLALAEGDLERNFAAPPDSAKLGCYWWWFNTDVDKAGITRSLEELHAKGFGSILFISSSGAGKGPAFLSPEWRELYKFALAEAARLNLEFGVNICSGWDMGGPWITPENAGRWYLQSEMSVVGPQKFSGKLPLPEPADGYKAATGKVAACLKLPFDKVDYRDSAVVAFREPETGSQWDEAKNSRLLTHKSNRQDAGPGGPDGTVLVPLGKHASDKPIPSADVIDLTAKLRADGSLDWEVPEGRWTILRTGHRMLGEAKTAYGQEGGEGLEVDWLSKAAVDQHWEGLVKILLADAGPLVGKTLKFIHTDSFEDCFPNWTQKFMDEFKRYRGYDMTPYLPVLRGRIVGSAEISDRFLHDYRKTVADCMADNNYGYLRELANKHGLELEAEAAGPSWSGTVCLDGLKNLGRCDRPMGEFWNDLFCRNLGTKEKPNQQNQVGKQTASAAHIYGHKTASAESFTSFLPFFTETPAFLKPIADRAFCEGINRCVHCFVRVSSSQEDGLPGPAILSGTQFNPKITWWQQAAGSWVGYINRCQALLQSGLFVADVLYYNGDWAPTLVRRKQVDPSLGQGYDYDDCNAEVLLTRLSVKDGRIVLPDGMSYRLLVLPDTTRILAGMAPKKTKAFPMPVEVIQKVKQLVQAGATVVGLPPESDPGLKDYPQCDAEVKAVAEELWGEASERTQNSEVRGQNKEKEVCRTYGKGRVITGKPLRQILLDDGVAPDFEHSGTNTFIDFIHRTADGAEIYFLANRKDRPESVECRFRVAGKQPELWNPVTGARRDLPEFKSENGVTALPLRFEANGSMFVVFKEKAQSGKNWRAEPATPSAPDTGSQAHPSKGGSTTGGQWRAEPATPKNFPEFKPIMDISGPWAVAFDAKWLYPKVGTPLRGVRGRVGPSTGLRTGDPSLPEEYQEVIFEKLEDWSKRPEDAIRYYSGTATYRKTFELDGSPTHGPTYLDLGAVSNGTARVTLNGKQLGVVWCPPWRVEISSAVKPGANVLEIEVVNLWPNRLIGDAKLPAEQRRTRPDRSPYSRPPKNGGEHKLFESGLLGPVRVMVEE